MKPSLTLRRRRTLFSLLLMVLLSAPGVAHAQLEIEGPPIEYSKRETSDRVSKLQRHIEDGSVQLEWQNSHGWLRSLLKALDVSPTSQTLVFSKTSLQIPKISPSRPRAIYFNEDVYVGWVQRGEVIEIASVDPEQGAVFYTLKQEKSEHPRVKRDEYGECLSCHQNGRTKQVPGFLVRSLYVQSDGQPELRLGSITTDHTTPFSKRFGGWYVTGQHGEMRHRGNFVLDTTNPSQISAPSDHVFDAGANATKIPTRVQTERYLQPTSDILALMLLEHQTQFHNAVTRASFTARIALYQQANMNRILDRDASFQSESTQRRLNTVTRELVDYLFFVNEAPLSDAIQGRSDFKDWFTSRGPRSPSGKSLRELDLTTRLLRYPCSYLIYSPAITSLPAPVRDRFRRRVMQVLESDVGEEHSDRYAHLSHEDRQAIREILVSTHPLFRPPQQTLDN